MASLIDSLRPVRTRGPIERLLVRIAALLVNEKRGFRRLVAPRIASLLERRVARSRAQVAVHRSAAPRTDAGKQVLLVSHDLSLSGAPKIVVELAEILLAAGHGVTVVAPAAGPLIDTFVAAGATVVIDFAALSDGGRVLGTLAAAADVAFCNTVVTRGAVRRLRAVVPTIWYLHEVSLIADWLVDDPCFGGDFALPWLVGDPGLGGDFALPRELWCGSEMSAVLVRPFRSDVRVVPYGLVSLGTPANGQPRDRDGAVRIAVFGSLEPRKGQDLAVEAIRSLPAVQRNLVHLTFYGRTLYVNYEAALRDAMQGLPISLGGELSPNAYRQAVLETDIVLVPSRDDTLPLVSLDALGASRVLACTPTTGTAAYLHGGVDGFVADAPTADAIARMLSEVLDRRNDWPGIGTNALRLFERAFSKEKFSRLVVESVDAVTRTTLP